MPELLEDLGEDILEHVLGVLPPEAEALAADRIDVAREPLDQLVPRLVVPAAASRDELLVGESGNSLHLLILRPDQASKLEPVSEITPEELQLAARNHGMPLETLRDAGDAGRTALLLIHYDIPPSTPPRGG